MSLQIEGQKLRELTSIGLFDPKAGAHGLGESEGDQGCVVLSRSEDTQDLKLGLGSIIPWKWISAPENLRIERMWHSPEQNWGTELNQEELWSGSPVSAGGHRPASEVGESVDEHTNSREEQENSELLQMSVCKE